MTKLHTFKLKLKWNLKYKTYLIQNIKYYKYINNTKITMIFLVNQLEFIFFLK